MADQKMFDCRDTWVETLADIAANDDRVVAIVNDSTGSSKLGKFKELYPKNTINVGIAEQNMVGVAAGFANGGRIPFVSCAGPFLSARAMEQIKVDVAYSKNNVKLVAQSPGVAYGELGPTHHSIEDLAWMRVLPGLVVVSPADPRETEQVVRWAAEYQGPVYIRVARMGVPRIYDESYQFRPGSAAVLRDGTDLTLIGTGTTVHRALDAARLLADTGVNARVLSMPTISPLDETAVLAAARETGAIVTVEEGFVSGLGGAVAELLAENQPTPMRRIGFREFAETGSAEWLFEQQSITPDGIAQVARELLTTVD